MYHVTSEHVLMVWKPEYWSPAVDIRCFLFSSRVNHICLPESLWDGFNWNTYRNMDDLSKQLKAIWFANTHTNVYQVLGSFINKQFRKLYKSLHVPILKCYHIKKKNHIHTYTHIQTRIQITAHVRLKRTVEYKKLQSVSMFKVLFSATN